MKAVNDVSSRCVPLNQGGRSQRLEPCASKGARTVLRGGGAGNSASLPDRLGTGNANGFAVLSKEEIVWQ